MNALIELGVLDAAAAIRQRRLSPVELVEAHLERIQTIDGDLNSFITVAAEQALSAARRSEEDACRGEFGGPLHGVPVAIKDNIATAEVRTTAGSRILADNIPREDATAVTRLVAAGAIVIGKTNLAEFAWGRPDNPFYGPTRNPWSRDRNALGSSGGSGGAVAARQVPAALGTDTGGSIRLPASACGVVGLRPTIGRVSNHGAVPCAWTMDTIGPLARSVADCAVLTGIIAGHDPRDPSCIPAPVPDYMERLELGLEGLAVGVPLPFALSRVQEDVRRAVEAALEVFAGAGATIVELNITELDEVYWPWRTVHTCEPTAYHGEWLRSRPDDYGEDVRTLLELGEVIRAADYIQAQRFRTKLRTVLVDVLSSVDVVLTPTLPFTAPLIDSTTIEIEPGHPEDIDPHMPRFTAAPSSAGLPALSIPGGFDRDGLPIGIQLMGRPYDEAMLFRFGHAFQRLTDWHTFAPAV